MKYNRASCVIFTRIYIAFLVAYFISIFVFKIWFNYISLTFFALGKIKIEWFLIIGPYEMFVTCIYAAFMSKKMSYLSLGFTVIELGFLLYFVTTCMDEVKGLFENENVWMFALFFQVAFIVLFAYRIIKLPKKLPKMKKEEPDSVPPAVQGKDVFMEFNNNDGVL